jgi:hypothetical protein
MFAARDQSCELRVAVERVADDQIALFYELRNQAPTAVFVFDGVDPKDAPFYVERRPGELIVSQKIIAPPRGLELERPEIPLASRLEPGQRIRHKLEMRLPLRASTPYPHLELRRERGEGYLVVDAFFEVGYFAPPDPSVAREAGEGAFVLPGLTPEMQTVLRAGPFGRVAFDPARR